MAVPDVGIDRRQRSCGAGASSSPGTSGSAGRRQYVPDVGIDGGSDGRGGTCQRRASQLPDGGIDGSAGSGIGTSTGTGIDRTGDVPDGGVGGG